MTIWRLLGNYTMLYIYGLDVPFGVLEGSAIVMYIDLVPSRWNYPLIILWNYFLDAYGDKWLITSVLLKIFKNILNIFRCYTVAFLEDRKYSTMAPFGGFAFIAAWASLLFWWFKLLQFVVHQNLSWECQLWLSWNLQLVRCIKFANCYLLVLSKVYDM